MNSLNIVSRLTATPPSSIPPSRTNSSARIYTLSEKRQIDENSDDSGSLDLGSLSEKLEGKEHSYDDDASTGQVSEHERRPLLLREDVPHDTDRPLPRRIASAILYGIKAVFSTIIAPGRYVIACFYDDHGHFSAILPLRNLRNLVHRRRQRVPSHIANPDQAVTDSSSDERPRRRKPSSKRTSSVASDAPTLLSGEEHEDSPSQHTRSRSTATQSVDDSTLHRKTIRIKLHGDGSTRSRKGSHSKRPPNDDSIDDVTSVASALKSPSSPATGAKLTRYPRTPAPPRPLIPRRQPSYILSYSPDTPKKTLVIDLDETLIHSMAKGGRMSTGHMVEVRLGGALSSSGAQIGPPGVPILYFVHERPGCHEFLRKVCKWYHLVVFTASVQEYADPVIDWLERERKYFTKRYYRQHCTLRKGAYIKDLAQVEPDLSKVMILDNSPMSYIFHEDNALPIEGWINDPTDNDLLHLVPFLEGLQYVTDVRALLALRQGQVQQT